MARLINNFVVFVCVLCAIATSFARNITLPAASAPINAVNKVYKAVTQQPIPQSDDQPIPQSNDQPVPDCLCGVFLSGQFVKGKTPAGEPVFTAGLADQMSCDTAGVKQCRDRCVEELMPYARNSSASICANAERDVYLEKAFVFVNNCDNGWVNTYISAGKRYCCKDGSYYKCPQPQ